MICMNCKTSHGCGCQARRASDGQIGCSKCINQLEEQIRIKKQQELTKKQQELNNQQK